MSECMTIADETIDQKDTCTEITPKSIVDFILEEALLSAFVNSDKGCSRIGDFNIVDDFRQDQLPHPKDFEQIDHSRTESTANQELNLNSGENVDRSARGNLELLIDSFVKKEEKLKPAGECTVITEEILANNELQIQNGQIHLEKNGKEGKIAPKPEINDNKEDDKVEIEYYNQGQLNKIYVPLNLTNGPEVGASAVDRTGQESEDGGRKEGQEWKDRGSKEGQEWEDRGSKEGQEWEDRGSKEGQEWEDGGDEGQENEGGGGKEEEDGLQARTEEDLERPFKPFTTEELRQVWGNGNSSLVGKWDGDALAQREEAVRLMEELSSVHVFPDSSADPNRPRACAFAEEDVKKIIKEIEEISFTQCHTNSEELDVAYHPEGQGDADLEVKSPPKSKDNFVISQKSKSPESSAAPDAQGTFTNGPSGNDKHGSKTQMDNINGEHRLSDEVNSSLCNACVEEESSPDVACNSKNNTYRNSSSDVSSSCLILEEYMSAEYRTMSTPLFGNSGDLTGSKIDEFRQKNMEMASELDVKPCQDVPPVLVQEFETGSNGLMGFNDPPQQDLNLAFGFLAQKCPNTEEDMTNEEAEEGSFFSQTDLAAEFPSENGLTEASASKQFELRSQKMYPGNNYDLAGRSANDFGLTESEEAFIDLMESVIQIIDPPENTTEEDTSQVSFSLLTGVRKSTADNEEADGELPLEKNISCSEVADPTKKVYSGMTTIGPMKNLDYDPKDLTAPDIDFGKMTRITSSRQLAKDFGLFSTEATSIKILEEDDSDDLGSGNTEEDPTDRTSLVNRDIASLTKVQKIREVMSYQPKAEEDFEDDEVLARPRLDLKDVESMTDERYKVPEVPIPLLSFEIGETDLSPEKEIIDSMGLVISGLTNPAYYEEEVEDEEDPCSETEHVGPLQPSDEKLPDRESSKNVVEDGEMPIVNSEKESSKVSIDDQQQDGGVKNQKYGTLGSVFRKASNKFLRKEGDLFMRNSKSLPRDASRVITSDSIRSMLDECQTSASNMLKKSRSLLKNTQGVFKSISQSRVTSDGVQKKPFSPSESDMTTMERKFSGFLKKEDFAKARNMIKEKVEKAFKNFESEGSPETETDSDKRNLRVVVRNKGNLQVDRIENFKKMLPKTPLVYKSQFVKSQMNVQSNPQETMEVASNVVAEEDQKTPEEILNSPTEDVSEVLHEEIDVEEESNTEKPDKLQWINAKEEFKSETNEEFEQEQPDFIVMETVQGLLSTDLESPSSEKENFNVENTVKIETGGNDQKKMEASNSLQALSNSGRDVTPCLTDTEDEKTQTKLLERKVKTKKKKFTARLRNFWCSAFGRVKTSPGKGDLS